MTDLDAIKKVAYELIVPISDPFGGPVSDGGSET